MNDATKKIGEELAAAIIEKFSSDEIKQLVESTKAASESATGTFEVVITTENLDRYSEVIKLDGWELTHYRNNPVVLWGHDHNTPIGVATSIDIVDGKMVAKGKFAPTEKAQEVRALYDAGIIRATSVGFIEKEREGNLITKAELLEFSFVSVPANPYALSLSMEKGFSVNELVTKGLMFVEKAANDETAEDETTAEPISSTDENGEEEVGKSFSTKQLSPVIDSLKAAIVALEALGSDTKELEGDDEVADDEDDLGDAAKGLSDFSEKRRIIQLAATVLGDVLAEARQAIERR